MSVSADNGAAHGAVWLGFVLFVGLLLVVDVVYLQTPLGSGRLSFNTAVKLTAFWISMALLFNLFVACSLGALSGFGFLQGLVLEYMLSFDNLFVFHLVFSYYCTPEALIYRALYFGIAGAIVLRVMFFTFGTTLMGTGLYVVKVAMGALLIYSGMRTVTDGDDEDISDPTNNPFVAWVTKHLPVSDNYEPNGHFFVTVAEVEFQPNLGSADGAWADEEALDARQRSDSMEVALAGLPRLESFEGSSLLDSRSSSVPLRAGTRSHDFRPESFEVTRKPARLRRKASLLLLVVVALWIVDVVFAVDSVASKLASVDDFFLNCSSSVFAMLSLRSMYFVMDALTQTFQMLKVGIAAILVLIGLKLVCSEWLTVSSEVSCAIFLGICAASISSSYWIPSLRENCELVELAQGGSAAEVEVSDDEELRPEEIIPASPPRLPALEERSNRMDHGILAGVRPQSKLPDTPNSPPHSPQLLVAELPPKPPLVTLEQQSDSSGSPARDNRDDKETDPATMQAAKPEEQALPPSGWTSTFAREESEEDCKDLPAE